ncbi:MAG TPA: sulfotransferase [Rhodanobacteraceae bacterium]|nr:sulfotransferase [Rhodanobacteraceae bacterium]
MTAARSEQAWLEDARTQVARGEASTAQATLDRALQAFPRSLELRRLQAGLLLRSGHTAQAEGLLRAVLADRAGDAGAAFALARLLKAQGRMAVAAATLKACLGSDGRDPDAGLAIAALELLDDCDRKRDAADIAETALEAAPNDARLHAYTGMLAIQLGEFERARRHDLFALEHDPRAWEWHVPLGLAATQRYASASHDDFARFANGLQREGLSDQARAELHFALGKAHDDVGDYAQAAAHFRRGNTLMQAIVQWPRRTWRRALRARLAAAPLAASAAPAERFTPIFIVGMPRSGTTLLAELLARHAGVLNRGELPWIARLAGQPALAGNPGASELTRVAATYVMQARRDDAADARWFIDKQPLNFRYVDLMLALFPDAKIIYSRRSARDTALSLWTQCFLESVQGYSYGFDDIAVVMRDCDQLMAHWQQRFPGAIRTVDYAHCVTDPDATIAALAEWIGLPEAQNAEPTPPRSKAAISSASLWQARQPVHTRSVHRAAHYLPYVPELERWPDA